MKEDQKYLSSQDAKNKLIESWLTCQQKKTLEMFDLCESPIEEFLLFEMIKQKEEIETDKRDFLVSGENCSIIIEPQSSISIGSDSYRLDFEVILNDQKVDIIHKFAIECDGYEFHEKTKEQASYDRKRERRLMSDGYHVIRFTGSEIYQSPTKCATDVFKIMCKITDKYRDFKKKIIREGEVK